MNARLAVAAALVAASLPVAAPAGPTGLCTSHLAEAPPPSPRPLTFGVTAAGQVFTPQPEQHPDDPARTLAAIGELAGERPFVVRLNRFFYKDGAEAIDRFEVLARRYTDAGHLVSLQIRYGPLWFPEQTPDGFVAWVREVVARLGANPGVIGAEVTNEPNLATAPDNSDGAHAGVIEALARGVIAAAHERDARGYAQLGVGFNWFHETGPVDERAFWESLAREGGAAFAQALDWVGLNAYPGTYDFAATAPGFEGREMIDALAKLRRCYLPAIGAGADVPIRVTENGYPDGFVVREPLMADTVERMVRAVHDHAGTFNVTHYLYFTLRDVRSGALQNEANYGLLAGDYTPKPAFGRYRDLVAELG